MRFNWLIPDPDYLHKVLTYSDGKLYWKSRGIPTFDAAWAGKEAGCYKYPCGYGTVSYKGEHLFVHRAIWIMHHGAISIDHEIDHIDGNRKNNKIENLRVCKKWQNMCNTKRRKDNKSGIKGIHKTEDGRYWRVRVQVNGKRKECGIYKTLEEAAMVAFKVRQENHGDFANHGKSDVEAA